MKIKTSGILYDKDGSPISEKEVSETFIDPESRRRLQKEQDKKDKDGEPVYRKVKDVLEETALNGSDEKDADKRRDFSTFLALRMAGDECELTEDQIKGLKDKLKIWPILIHGQLTAVLEGKENPMEPTKSSKK